MRIWALVLCAGLWAGCSVVDSGAPGPDAGQDRLDDPGLSGPPFAELGQACGGDANCHSDLCVTAWDPPNSPQEHVEFPGGMCTTRCDFTNPYDSCPDDRFCMLGTDKDAHCFSQCETSADCRHAEGWRCQALGFSCTVNVCLPPDIRGNENCPKL